MRHCLARCRRLRVFAAVTAAGMLAACGSAGVGGGTIGSGGNGSGVVGSATLTWEAPTTLVDGRPLTDLAGYEVHYGTSPGYYDVAIDVGNVTEITVENLPADTYYFAVLAYTATGLTSGFSREVSKKIP